MKVGVKLPLLPEQVACSLKHQRAMVLPDKVTCALHSGRSQWTHSPKHVSDSFGKGLLADFCKVNRTLI
jgi:hypothetical protein